VHDVAKESRIGQAGGHHIPWGNLDAFDVDRPSLVQSEFVQCLENVDELGAEAVFERDALGLDLFTNANSRRGPAFSHSSARSHVAPSSRHGGGWE
jgi:hypothetical protein